MELFVEKSLEIGKRIRRLREKQELSREAFCGDGTKLTIRLVSIK